MCISGAEMLAQWNKIVFATLSKTQDLIDYKIPGMLYLA